MPTLAVFQLYHGILSVLGVTTVSKFIKNNQAFHSIFGHMTFQVKHEISLDKKKKTHPYGGLSLDKKNQQIIV